MPFWCSAGPSRAEFLQTYDPDVVLGGGFGEDILASHVDPIIGAIGNIGWLAKLRLRNLVWAAGLHVPHGFRRDIYSASGARAAENCSNGSRKSRVGSSCGGHA